MQIGPYSFDKPLVLAPMAGVTDRPFRLLCRRLGADLAVSEMVTADTSLWGSKKSLNRLNHSGEPGPRAVQIVGSDPVKMAQAPKAITPRSKMIHRAKAKILLMFVWFRPFMRQRPAASPPQARIASHGNNHK